MGWPAMSYVIVVADTKYVKKLTFEFPATMPKVETTPHKFEAVVIYDFRAAQGIANLLRGHVARGDM